MLHAGLSAAPTGAPLGRERNLEPGRPDPGPIEARPSGAEREDSA